MHNDTAELLTTIKTRGMVPANPGSWSDAQLLKAASDEIEKWHLPMLIDAKGEYLVKEQLITLVSGTASYLISYRAAAVRNASLKLADGRELPLAEMPPNEQTTTRLNRNARGIPQVYAFREGYIDLYPVPDSTVGQLWLKWHIRPSRLVLTTDCRQCLNKFTDNPSPGYTRISLGTDAASATASTAQANSLGGLFDFVGVRNPHPIKAWDVSKQSLITGGVSTTIDFLTADLPTDLVVGAYGDWLCPSQQTPQPNTLAELHSPAALRAAAAAVRSRNDTLADMLIAEAAAGEASLLRGVLAQRNKAALQRLVQRRW